MAVGGLTVTFWTFRSVSKGSVIWNLLQLSDLDDPISLESAATDPPAGTD